MPKNVTGLVGLKNMVAIMGTIIGVIIGYFLDRKLNEIIGVKIYSGGEGGYILSVADVLVAVIGLVLIWFGGRLHRIVRYIGLGIVALEVAEEIYEIATGEPSF